MFVENWPGPHSLLLHQPPLREVQMGQVAIMAALYQAWFFFPPKTFFLEKGILGKRIPLEG